MDGVATNTGKSCWPSPFVPESVLMSRLREGRANTARGAATSCGRRWDRYAGANGRLTLRADRSTLSVVSACREMMSASPSHPPAQKPALSTIPDADWTPVPSGWTAPPPDHLHPLP